MAQRRHHYERAFESYLRSNRIPYIAVDEARRALVPGAGDGRFEAPRLAAEEDARALKSFDFVVYGRERSLLVETKGRKLPAGRRAPTWSSMQNWVTSADLDSLSRWSELFGDGFDSSFIFIYWCEAQPPDGLYQEVFEHEGRWYALREAPLDQYSAFARVRSARWDTVSVPAADYARISRPFRGGDWPSAPSPPAIPDALHPCGPSVSSVA